MNAPPQILTTGSVLDKIAAATKARVEAAKQAASIAELEANADAAAPAKNFAAAFAAPGPNIIAEVKLASPSHGPIAANVDPVGIARDYAANGAAAISVLTEPEFFGGSLANLSAIRAAVDVPLLMKDFILDEFQLLQGRAAGADAALLIVAMLGAAGLRALLPKVAALGMAALVEVHDAAELEIAAAAGAKIIGINNRNLKTLHIDLAVTRELAPIARQIPGAIVIAESGIATRGDLKSLAESGVDGYLIGTHFVASGRPGAALAELLDVREM